MKPSSSIAAAAACFLGLSAAPAFARGALISGWIPPAQHGGFTANPKPERLGPAAKQASLGAPVHRHRRWRPGVDSAFYAAPPSEPSATEPNDIFDDDFHGAPARRVACVKPRVIELAPPAAADAPLPRVVYGQRPPCGGSRSY